MGLRERWLSAHTVDGAPVRDAEAGLEGFEVREYVLGEHIYQVGDTAHEFYLILSGVVLVYLESESGPQTIAELRASEYLGEISCLQGERRAANAIVTESCRVLVIPEAEAERAIALLPRWFVTLVESLMTRLSGTLLKVAAANSAHEERNHSA